jgi:hypothetical protein
VGGFLPGQWAGLNPAGRSAANAGAASRQNTSNIPLSIYKDAKHQICVQQWTRMK